MSEEIKRKKHTKFSDIVTHFLETPDCRPKRVDAFSAIVIHHTAGTADTPEGWARIARGVADWLTRKDDVYVSAHFQIDREGDIWQICDPKKFEAFHAGRSERWHQASRKVVNGWNRISIGIELVGDGNKSFYSPAQYSSLIALCKELMVAFPISIKDVVGHDEISPGRKVDPGQNFDWDNFIRKLVSEETN